ncbi:MAG: GAF domain-containing protein [Syntrophobacter sp.]
MEISSGLSDIRNWDEQCEAVKDVLAGLAEELAAQTGADIVTILVGDRAKTEIHLAVGYGLDDPDTFYDLRMPARMDRVAGQVMKGKAAIIAETIDGHPIMDGPFARRERVKSSAGFPLVHGSEAFGAIFISFRNQHSFRESDYQTVGTIGEKAAEVIAEAESCLRVKKPEPQVSEEEKILRAVVSLARNVVKLPIAIWLREPRGCDIRVRSGTGLTHGYFNQATATLGDSSIISEVIQGGKPIIIGDLTRDMRFPYAVHARAAGWRSTLCFPIKLRGQTRGVIQVFTYDTREFENAEFDTLNYLSDLARVALENAYHAQEAELMSRLVHSLSATPNPDSAMQVIADIARELTGANSALIATLERRSGTYAVGCCSPAQEDEICSRIAAEGALTDQIIKSDECIVMDDTKRDPRAPQDIIDAGVRSLLGVRIQTGDEQIGVLYAHGRVVQQFSEYHARLLRMMANQASIALGRTRLLLNSWREIEEAKARLFQLEPAINRFCQELQDSREFDFVAVQLVRPRDSVIETMHGTGIAAHWTGVAKHYLVKDSKLRDIQADIYHTLCTEIISGWDSRFDRWVYDNYGHERLVRVFIPIVLVRNHETGKVDTQWFEHCEWSLINEQKSEEGTTSTISMRIRGLESGTMTTECLGTVEAGFENPNRSISHLDAIELAKQVSSWAIKIQRYLLPYVLEVIVKNAMKSIHATSASLHFHYDREFRRHVYETCAGKIGQSFLRRNPPRQVGFGTAALQTGKPVFAPDRSAGHDEHVLRHLNPRIYREGIMAIAAFPLFAGESDGHLYVHFNKEHWFTEEEIMWVQLVAKRATDAIQDANSFIDMRDRANKLAALQSVTHSLIKIPTASTLLAHISSIALNILVADVVTVHEYFEPKETFGKPPTIAGKLKAEKAMYTDAQFDAPALLVAGGKNIYEKMSRRNPILIGLGTMPPHHSSFLVREGIRSTAGVLLKVGLETVGVMFINYRRQHDFSEDDIWFIETLASSAALAIRNLRLLDVFADRALNVNTDLEWILNTVVERAMSITGASMADIRLLEPASTELVLKARYPEIISDSLPSANFKIGEGLVGWVAKNRKPALVNDVLKDKRYMQCFPNVASELCVPLLNGERRALGVLNVESYRLGAFTPKDERMLESLATQLVFTMEYLDNRRQLMAAENILAVSSGAGNLVHKTNNDVGGIRVYANDILNTCGSNDSIRRGATKILSIAERLIAEARTLRMWNPSSGTTSEIKTVVEKALKRVEIPGGINKELKLPASLPRVRGSDQLLIEVFSTLFQNSVDAMAENGTLAIGAFESTEYPLVTVWVADTGVGIREEDLPRIFEMNFSTKRSDARLGFGLWWARNYVVMLKGDIAVESKEGRGTKFTIILPSQE